MKYLLSVLLLFFIGCKSKPVKQTVYVHDTIMINNSVDSLIAQVKPLLVNYYKAGYMDALNGSIDLYNDNHLDQRHMNLQKQKYFDWVEKRVINTNTPKP